MCNLPQNAELSPRMDARYSNILVLVVVLYMLDGQNQMDRSSIRGGYCCWYGAHCDRYNEWNMCSPTTKAEKKRQEKKPEKKQDKKVKR